MALVMFTVSSTRQKSATAVAIAAPTLLILYNRVYTHMHHTFSNIICMLTQLDWEEFVSDILENTTNITVNASEVVIVRTPTYFANLTDILSAANDRYSYSI